MTCASGRTSRCVLLKSCVRPAGTIPYPGSDRRQPAQCGCSRKLFSCLCSVPGCSRKCFFCFIFPGNVFFVYVLFSAAELAVGARGPLLVVSPIRSPFRLPNEFSSSKRAFPLPGLLRANATHHPGAKKTPHHGHA